MADTKITGLTALTVPAGEDLLAIVDDPSGTPTTKKVTVENLRKQITGRYAEVYDTGGDLTLNGTSWQNLDTVSATRFDVTLTNVAVGDYVQVLMAARVQAEAVLQFFDAISVGGSAPEAWGNRGTESASSGGFEGWVCAQSVIMAISGGPIKAVVSGDLSGTSLTLRPRARQSSAGNKTIFASSNHPLYFSARNLGPGV